MTRRRDRNEEDPIRPLRSMPDYTGHRRRTALSAAEYDRIYFIDENWNRLVPHRNGVDVGEEPTRFKGEIEYLPLKGEYLITEGAKRIFEVLRVIHELNKVKRTPPRIFVMVREKKGFS